jgi:hypothetical protein
MDATTFLASQRQIQLDRKDGYSTGVEMCKFDHVHGSTVCSALFEHHVEPDGRVVHYYYTDKMNELVGARARVLAGSLVGSARQRTHVVARQLV